MISDLLYRCPICGSFDWLENEHCCACGAEVKDGCRTHLLVDGRKEPVSYWYEKIRSFDLPVSEKGIILKSGRIDLSEETVSGRFRGLCGLTGLFYKRKPVDDGRLSLRPDRLIFSGRRGNRVISFDSVVSVTIESNTVIVVSRVYGPLFFDFREESGKKWEDCIQKAVARYHAPRVITEFCPRIRFSDDIRLPALPAPDTGGAFRVPVRRWYANDHSRFLLAVRRVLKLVVSRILPLKIEGLENIPATGAAVLTANHSSFIDSIVLELFTRRLIWFMTKNSQYRGTFLNWLLRLAGSFPVRRYTVDPQAIRNAIRVVQEGHVLGIFPEGERSWDGRMLPFKQGTMRLILALGEPVIPVAISGAYGLMPRWTTRLRRVPVTIRIGRPVRLDRIPLAAQRQEDIDRASGQLRQFILDLMDP